MAKSIWTILGIEATNDRGAIRRAYAVALKATNPEDDGAAFQALRHAYEMALDYAGQRRTAQEVAEVPQASDLAKDLEAAPHPVDDLVAPEPGPPPAPAQDSVIANHVASCNRLLSQVTNSAPAKSAELIESLKLIFSQPALSNVGIAIETEQWLARLIAANAPHSDPLLKPVIARFGWTINVIDRPDAGLIRHLVQRQTDLEFLATCSQPRDPRYGPMTALKEPPRRMPWWQVIIEPPGLDKVRDFYSVVEQPPLRDHFDQASLSAWGAFLDRPRLPVLWAEVAILAPIVIALILLILRLAKQNDFVLTEYLPAAGICLAAIGALFVCALIILHIVHWPRLIWRKRLKRASAPAWLAIGWAPCAIGLLMASAILPTQPPILTYVAIAAAAISYWAVVTREAAPSFTGTSWFWQLGLGYVALAIWWLLVARQYWSDRFVLMSIAFLGAAAASGAGTRSIMKQWQRLPTRIIRRMCALALAAIACGVGYLLWAAMRDPDLAPVAACSVASISLTSRAAYKTPPRILVRFWQFAVWVIGYSAFNASQSGDSAMLLGVVPLSVALINVWTEAVA